MQMYKVITGLSIFLMTLFILSFSSSINIIKQDMEIAELALWVSFILLISVAAGKLIVEAIFPGTRGGK